ncbi:hypothetical protein ACFOWE_24545 [Planomonospora corallina]|uniref:VWA domain-containing protein n=1 Tax=Planomonospora corallina TaxID=1806052 RepID=A0ABV8IEP3_9ACTN
MSADRHIAIVLDRSGSMAAARAATENGLRAFLTEQRTADGTATVSLYTFDDRFEAVYEDLPLPAVPGFHLHPRGATALLDAIGHTIARTRHRLSTLAEADRPGQVAVVILTDGVDNASTIYDTAQIRALITGLQAAPRPWTFVFLGAALDTFEVARGLGIDAATTLHYDTDRTETGVEEQRYSH